MSNPVADFYQKLLGDKSLRRLAQNSGILLAGDTGSVVLVLVAIVLTTRQLGAELFGVLVLAQGFALLIDQLVNFQSWKALIKFGTEDLATEAPDAFEQHVKLAFFLDLISALAGASLGFFLAPLAGRILSWDTTTTTLAAFYSLTIALNITGMPTGVLRIFSEFRAFAVRKVAGGIIKLGGVLFAILFGWGLTGFVTVWIVTDAIGYALVVIYALLVLQKRGHGGWCRRPFGEWRAFTTFTVWSNLSSTVSIPIKRLDIFIVDALLSTETVGIYRVFRQLSDIFTRFADAVYQAIYPEFTSLLARVRGIETLRLVARSGIVLVAITLPIAVLMGITGPWWLELIFGTPFAKEALSLSVFLIFRAVWTGFIGVYPLFIAMGFVRTDFVIVIVNNTIYLLTALALGPHWGLLGIVFAFIATFLFAATTRLIFVLKNVAKPDFTMQT